MSKIKMKHVFALVMVGGVCNAVTADEDAFMKLDRNADGFISAEESMVNDALYKGWPSADANNDGRVDSAEFSAFEINNSKVQQEE